MLILYKEQQMRIKIAETLFNKSDMKLVLGVLRAKVTVGKTKEALWEQLQLLGETQKNKYQNIVPATIEPIKALISTYKTLGLKLSEYKGSNELLLKRILALKGLYQVNTVVDANNLISVDSLRSVGSYDLSNISGDITFREGTSEETYIGTTKKALNLAKLPVLCDSNGPFGSPTSDSKRALITETTTDLMTVIYSFDGEEGLQTQLEQMGALLKEYSMATNIQYHIVKDEFVTLTPAALENDVTDGLTPQAAGLSIFSEKTPVPVTSTSESAASVLTSEFIL